MLTELQPVREILSHVVTAEWQHRERITTHNTKLTSCCGGGFRTHRCSHVNTFSPVTCLCHQRNSRGATSAKDKCVNDYALRIVPFWIQNRVLGRRHSKARIGMSRFNTLFFSKLRGPVTALPVNGVGGWNLGHAFPPHIALVGQCNVGENRVTTQCRHAIKV